MKWNEERNLITALAQKSIRLTTDNCNMYHDLEEIKELTESIHIGACYTDEQEYLKKIIENNAEVSTNSRSFFVI